MTEVDIHCDRFRRNFFNGHHIKLLFIDQIFYHKTQIKYLNYNQHRVKHRVEHKMIKEYYLKIPLNNHYDK